MSIDLIKTEGVFTTGSRNVEITGVTPAAIGDATIVHVDGFYLPVQAVDWIGTNLRLLDNWAGAGGTYDVLIYNTNEGLANLVRRLRESINDVSTLNLAFKELLTSTDPTITIELDNGDIVEVVPWGYIRDTAQAELDQFLLDNQNAITRTEVEKELKRNASLYADFTQDEAVVSAGLSKVASGVADAITMTNPDGITGIGADGRIYYSGVGNVPIVYNGEGVCQGLQTAPTSTNLLRWSEDFTQSDWSGGVLTAVLISDSSAPLGFYYGLTESTAASSQTITQRYTANDSGVFSAKVCIDAEGRTKSRLNLRASTGESARVNIDFTDGSLASNAYSGATLIDTSVVRLSGGFYEVTLVAGFSSFSHIDTQIQALEASSGIGAGGSYTGDGRVALKVCYADLFKGYPVPHIKTEGSQVTRGQVGANSGALGSALNDNQGTLYWEGVIQDSTDVRGIACLGAVGSEVNNCISLLQRTQSSSVQLIIRSDGAVTQQTFGSSVINSFNKIAVTYDFGNSVAYASINGSDAVQITINSKPSGFTGDNIALILGKYRRLADPQQIQQCGKATYSPKLITPAELKALTTLED